MLTKEAAEALGSEVAAANQPDDRRVKLAQAVVTLVKKAGVKKAGMGWGSAIGGAMPLVKKLLPWLGGVGGMGAAYLLGRKQPGQAATPTGGPGGLFGGKKQQLWDPHSKAMFGRMGINPMEMAARQRSMFDVGAGGQWRAAEQKARQNMIRGMYNV
jgi:hypothetical protein